jgi:anti-sigma B factor antagonist
MTSAHETRDAYFEVAVQRSSGTAVVRLAGELDLGSAPTLADALRSLEQPCDRVILDLSRLTFIDSSGLRLALTEHRRAEADGFDFVLAGATEPILRVLRVTGLDVALPMAPDVASALDSSDGAVDLRRAT